MHVENLRHPLTRLKKLVSKMHRSTIAIIAAGILSLITGLLVAHDYASGGTFSLPLMGVTQIVVGLAFILIAVRGGGNGKTRK